MARSYLACLTIVLLMMASSVLVVTSVADASVGATCPDNDNPATGAPHRFARERATGTYYGQFALLRTYQPLVVNYHNDFSLSHIYPYYGQQSEYGATFGEVGYYVGVGADNSGNDFQSPHFYIAWRDMQGAQLYHESNNTSSTLTLGGDYSYEIVYVGYNYTLAANEWNVYYSGTSVIRGVIHFVNMNANHALAGGEVLSDSSHFVAMQTRGVPDQKLISVTGIGHEWDSTYAADTSLCQGVGLDFTDVSSYDAFTANGSV